tara:strand:+ start:1814 stop:2674 length:861 start_codon:yes stop_codon:yes gene_type:complete
VNPDRAILTGHCADKKGLVAAITEWISDNGGNILHLDQHVDPATDHFFIRVEWHLEGFVHGRETIAHQFQTDVAGRIGLDASIRFTSDRLRMALFVSRLGHCLWDILARCESGEWNVEVPLIISNHPDFEGTAQQFGVPFHVIPITAETKADQERRELELLAEHNVDFIVLCRYMQVLSADFAAQYPNRIINIHHSFLPAFAGAKPYHRAHERGVKLIGATAHYVTLDLDEGPIIEQDTARVSHRDAVQDMVRLGKDLEKIVLSRAIFLHLNSQVIVHGNRTVVFT